MRVLVKTARIRIVDSASETTVELAAYDAMGEPIWLRVPPPDDAAQRKVYNALLRIVLLGDEEIL